MQELPLLLNTQQEDLDLYRILYRIRRFEESVLENFPLGVFMGTTHTYLGQEANAVGVLSQIEPEDIIFSSHRCHGHFLAYGGDMRALYAELMGRATGVCGGRGGSQHLHWRNFYSNGIQGGIVPIVTGMALAEKRKGSGAVAIAFLGDGTFGEGIVYEALNMASLWKAPVLYVLENNRIAQTTPVGLAAAGEFKARFQAFDIPTLELDSSDVREILSAAKHMLTGVRDRSAPGALILSTCRFGPHSKGDDTREAGELEKARRERDPVKIQAARVNPSSIEIIEAETKAEITAAFNQALNDPWPDKVL
jgi:acetoin:2,6-dichlorophenolindophenol oxidoreductase subunit alpha